MQRPASATTFGILNIIFAGLGVFGLVASITLLTVMDTRNPVVRIIQNNPAYAAWMKLSVPLGLLSCAILLTAGIGLLRMKNWARLLSIGYAIYAILFGIVGIVINFLFLVRPMLEEASHKQGPEAAGEIGGAIGGGIGGCIGLVYPVLLLIFMTRPKLVAAFRATNPPPLP
jgi:hypothetical protein